ncbi:MAG: transketolase [Dehalococcoidia bacterium]|nr:transketolase [Dehalococcoidia bacterium]
MESGAPDQLSVNAIRFLSADAIQEANSGHPGAPMGAAPLAYTLWDRFLQHNPSNPEWANRDRFVLSNGHASMLLYSLLHLTGYNLPMEQIKQFRQWGSITPGHPERGVTPGVEITTGPLGQGFANALGMAISEKMLAARYNHPGHEIIDHRTYALVSDGDLQEGVASEAASLAGTLGLDKLTYLYDDNKITIEGHTSLAFREDVAARFRAYGFEVIGPVDGNDINALDEAIGQAQTAYRKPSLIVVQTTIGYGSPNKANTPGAHGEALGAEELAATREALGWEHGAFEIPADVTDHMRKALDRGARAEEEWAARLAAYSAAYPEDAASLKRDLAGELPTGWDAGLDALYDAFNDPVASRAVSGRALAAITERVGNLIGGSADLAPSNNTRVQGRGSFQAETYPGRNMHFGVREHAMGAVANGMAAHGGLIPYTGTFLVFSDYMRPALRLAAMSGLHSVFIYTHDSVGLGEDGPTHQPISQLMSLRSIPGLVVIRPADAHETLEAWRFAVTHDGPVVLALSRQALPTLQRDSDTGAAELARGGYVVTAGGEDPDVLLIGTGSEVSLAQSAAGLLAEDGVAARVVSMPSWELFDAQPPGYRDGVLPPSIRARVSIEAGASIGWARYIGLDGASIGMNGYGASAPGPEVLARFGFTAENVQSTALSIIENLR